MHYYLNVQHSYFHEGQALFTPPPPERALHSKKLYRPTETLKTTALSDKQIADGRDNRLFALALKTTQSNRH